MPARRNRIVAVLLALAALALAIGSAASGAPPDPPVVTITQAPPAFSNQAAATFEFTVDDAQANVECWVDDQLVHRSPCASPYQTDTLADGPHTFHILATRGSDQTPADYQWTIDTVAPAVAITPLPNDFSTSKTPPLEFTVTDASPTTAECWVDDGPHQAGCTSPYTPASLADGQHTLHVIATDAAGNASAQADYTFTIDAPPAVSFSSGPPASTSDQSASFSFATDDPAATLTCALDDGPFDVCTSPKSYDGLAYGDHTFRVRATDTFGNVSEVAYTWTITLFNQGVVGPDVTPPASAEPLDYFVSYRYLQLTWAKPKDDDFDHFTVFATAGAGGDRVEVYSGAATRYRDSKFNNAVDYSYQVIAYDHAGNASPAASIAISSSALLSSPRRGARLRTAPTLAWAPIAKARFYNVQLFRNGRKVMSTWPRRARVHLSARWRYQNRTYKLTPGRYDWYVWPAFRSGRSIRYGAALGHSFFRR